MNEDNAILKARKKRTFNKVRRTRKTRRTIHF